MEVVTHKQGNYMRQLTLDIWYKNTFPMFHFYLDETNRYGELNWKLKRDGSPKLLMTKRELKQLIADDQSLKTTDITCIEIGGI